MIRSDRLPAYLFIAPDGSEQILKPGEQCARIRAIANRVRAAAAPGSVVGLMYPSSPELILAWLGCVLAGTQPLIMQYPTAKQTRLYWENSVTNTIGVANVALVLCDARCAGMGLAKLVPILDQAELDALPPASPAPFVVNAFAIIQLSSGTTGHRKAMRMEGVALLRHVTDYNAVLGLGREDRVVSWLPLYHDMGYVACFVMPMLLGIDVVMMDPVAWVARPSMLLDAIEKHAGTICYMPNFGFEVMARETPRRLPSMRWWISCSEPVSPATARRFAAHMGIAESDFAPCYAMAENLFAVSIGRGITTREIDGVEVISCGAPIPGVRVKLKDGEIWVRSPASISAYLGGEDIRDAEGFYPTGDLGELHDGALFVTGRRQDLLIQAGRKFMLSDIDLLVNRLYPDIRGRAAALARNDARLGTQVCVVLIESPAFFARTDQASIADALRQAANLDQIEVAFVPPRFLTKTSSGKINRKLSAAHWQAVQDARNAMSAAERGADSGSNFAAELREAFPRVARDAPVGGILDSLSLTVLRIILSGAGLPYDPDRTLAEIEAMLSEGVAGAAPDQEVGLRIVSLADRHTLTKLTEKHLDQLSRRLGCPVSLEHVCLPPSPVILSDLVFADYFAPRLEPGALSSVQACLAKLRGASVIVTDDAAEMRLPPNQAYGVLSHNLERDPRSDLITVRWQHYARQHHLLPTTFVAGRDLPLEERTATLDRLAAYLRKPLFRIASFSGLESLTRGWEFRSFPDSDEPPLAEGLVRPDRMLEALADWIDALPEPPARVTLPRAGRLDMNDLGHFCSHFAYQPHIDKLLDAYGSFCIAGQESSIPYIRRVLSEAGKPFVCVPSYAPEILATVELDYECLLICGAWGNFPLTKPTGAIMFIAHGGASTFNIADPRLAALKFKRNASFDPPSSTDWYFLGKLHRDWDVEMWAADRVAKAAEKKKGGEGNGAGAARARALCEQAKQARADGSYAAARDFAARAIEADPLSSVGYRLLAAVCSDLGDVEAVAEACARAVARLPSEADAFARIEMVARRKAAGEVKRKMVAAGSEARDFDAGL
jgi:acyl-CoA synthetase (AMP-forming)/AMP-acid ligase II